MQVAIRTDASLAIGTGHVARSLTLAARLRERGAQVTFLCRALPGDRAAAIRAAGFELHSLGAPAATGGAEIADSERALRSLGDVDWLVIDHYELDAGFERAMRGAARQIAVIDDLARAHDCDILIDHNVDARGAARYDGLIPAHARRFVGPQFALLRAEFARARATLEPRSGALRRVLISMGGVDAADATTVATRGFLAAGLDARADIVLPASAPHFAAVRALSESDGRVSVHGDASDMAAFIARADLAIGAAGTSSWERAYLGLPALLMAVADNQTRVALALDAAGAAIALGSREEIDAGRIAQTLRRLAESPERLRAMSRRAHALMDGSEAAVAELLDAFAPALRR